MISFTEGTVSEAAPKRSTSLVSSSGLADNETPQLTSLIIINSVQRQNEGFVTMTEPLARSTCIAAIYPGLLANQTMNLVGFGIKLILDPDHLKYLVSNCGLVVLSFR
jgi:hypothetical protein